ncbi:MAG: insulinase family protein [Betaproteobacteria bacterium]|nr:insulinase family protein [Betaproteobacteria bacterium]
MLLAAGAWADAKTGLPAGVVQVHQLEGVTEYRLANGLQVLLAPDASKPTTTVNVTYRVGSRMEDYGETGMAHLLEHLMFKGTPSHRNITAELTRRGMRPNGTTWFDRTNYFETFAASPANLDWALRMEADRMVHSFIARKDLDSEMTVVRNEMESGENDPGEVLMDKVMAAAYQWHNYGKSTIGARSDVENVSIPHLQAFYRKYYQPDNATLVVAGSFDAAKTLAFIQDVFGKIPRPKRVLEPTYTLDPVQDGEREVVLRRVGDIQYVEAVYHAVAAASPDSAAFEVLAQVLGDTPSGRLHQALVEKGLATATTADYFNLDEPGVIFFQADVRKGQSLDAVRDAFLKTIEDMKAHPVTAAEVDRAKANLQNGIEITFNDPERFGIALSTAIANGDWRLFFLTRDRIAKVQPADVQRVAEAYLVPSNRTLGLFMPTASPVRAPAPRREDAEAQLKGYQGNPHFAAGEAFDPAPANIQLRTQWLTLPGGMQVALLPKKTRGGTVHAQIHLHFGTAQSLEGKSSIGDLAGSLLDRGAAGMSRQEIQDRFTALKAQVAFDGSAAGATVSIQTVRENLPATLDLVARILRQPQFPESEFKQAREAELADIEESRSDPQARASNAMGRYFNRHPRGDVRYVSTFDESVEDVKAVTLEQLKAFHKDFYGADHAEVAIVGDFEAKAALEALRKGLDGWKSASPYELVIDDYKVFPGKRIQIDTPDKANAVFLMREPLALMDSDPDAPALTLGNYILGEGFLNSRLATRIRQKEGLSYGVGSYLRLNDKVRNSQFGAYAIYAPQNLARLETSFGEVIRQVIREGVKPEEVQAAQSALLQSRQLSRSQDGTLAALLNKLMFDHRTMNFVADFDRDLAALDATAVNKALQHYLDPERFVEVVAGDFAKKKAP